MKEFAAAQAAQKLLGILDGGQWVFAAAQAAQKCAGGLLARGRGWEGSKRRRPASLRAFAILAPEVRLELTTP
jgi:hypothetical protein